MFVGVLKN